MNTKQRALALLFLLALPCLAPHARAEALTLPAQLTEVAEEAFAGDANIVEVVLPEGVTAIGDRAFSGCAGLGWVTIPGSVTRLGEDVFIGCAEDLLLRAQAGSAARDYARLHSIDYQAGTVYRALLIGQSFADSDDMTPLAGPENDVAALDACLSDFGGTPYQVTIRRNLTAEGILAAVADAFNGATEDDVSLFHYSGHGILLSDGNSQSALVGADSEDYVTADQLRAALDQVPGRKIVVIDACYSGGMLAADTRGASLRAMSVASATDAASRPEAFLDAFIGSFSPKMRRSLAAADYFVLTAAAADEQSYENEAGGRVMGLFTYNLITGLGHEPSGEPLSSLPADADGNGVITLKEAYQYTRKKLIADGQHVQVYPESCGWFGILRQGR